MGPRMEELFKTEVDDFNVKEYWHKCLEICWLMAIQDPPVSMETNAERHGEVFDYGRYRHYTKPGKYIDFIVWPALNVTTEGSILYKGVAQGKDTPYI
ncbi:hypothetical protein DPMN_112392 [Dreissena polymorpha]|uniref:Mitochondria-eating protein C-terminal domain-containing protein n=1 Tax=Dreissena polymorpha TaxID=45954 RepID=A0A9D4KGC0_DREPO|nr:hypothetical protein DPMN_112392 [Dreissena polymorpha]